MPSSWLACLFSLCLVWDVQPSVATPPAVVSVQILNGTRGACPTESQLAEARGQLRLEVASALDAYSRLANAVDSCGDLPITSSTGYYLISSGDASAPVLTFCNLTAMNPLTSCSDLPDGSPGGYYWTLPITGLSAELRYCNRNLHRLEGCGGDSWTQVGYLNMSDPNETCPGDWVLSNSTRACGHALGSSTDPGCSSANFPTPGAYSHVCGRVIAYHKGWANGLQFGRHLEHAYLDGISITHGPRLARQHVWSFVAASGEHSAFQAGSLCSCSNRNPWEHEFFVSFLGNNYFCDTGNHNSSTSDSLLNYNDPLWDGEGCGLDSSCCQFRNPPWFQMSLPQQTTDHLEIRNCHALSVSFNTLVKLIEIYVK
jgi:hypothetical protein